MHPSKLALIVISLLGIITAFLPWQTLIVLGETVSTQGTETSIMFKKTQIGDGWFSVYAFSLAIILSIIGKRSISIGLVKKIVIALLGILTIYMAAFDSVQMKKMFQEIGNSPLAMQSKPGYGLYATMAIAGILVIASLIPFKRKEAKKTPAWWAGVAI